MVSRGHKPKIGDAKIIIEEVLDADMKYRRELGAFGPDDRRTKLRGYMFERSLEALRWWYNTRFPA